MPRPDMVTLSATDSVTSALDTAIEHGYSRFPVIGETLDEVRRHRLHQGPHAGRSARGGATSPSPAWSAPAHFVPETKPVARLMREMQAGKFHMAILVDEYGGIAGLVTLEDCIEELVGDIFDEYDVEDSEVERLADGELRVDGGLSIDELNELLDLELPDDDWDTVGGFLLGTLGHVPERGRERRARTATASRWRRWRATASPGCGSAAAAPVEPDGRGPRDRDRSAPAS